MWKILEAQVERLTAKLSHAQVKNDALELKLKRAEDLEERLQLQIHQQQIENQELMRRLKKEEHDKNKSDKFFMK
jgi:hypothetical protein